MSWPSFDDVADALRHPLRCFSDAELRRAQATPAAGGPLFRPGTHSDVFQLRSAGGLNRWAVKFARQETPHLDRHYRALAEHLQQTDLPWLAALQFQEHGLSVRGRGFPFLKMRWLDGSPLHAFVAEHADRPEVLRLVVRHWLQLAQDLRAAGLAHGALQHDHVLVDLGGGQCSLRLLDYDAMFCPTRAGEEPLELGHPAYDHPERAWRRTYDAEVDRFPLLVIYVSLLAVAAGGRDLWRRYHDGDHLLFKESDFAEPGESALFGELWRSPSKAVRALAGRLLLALRGRPADVPLLSELEAEACTRLAQDPSDLPHLHLTAEDREQIEATLGAPSVGSGPRRTFGILLEPGTTGLGREDDNFDLVVDDEPAVGRATTMPPPLPAAVSGFEPPPLPVLTAEAPPLTTVEPMVVPPPADPRAGVYRIEAWMPEQVAVMKVKGFVEACTGEVVLSQPGMMRVQLLDAVALANPPRPGLMALLGLAEEPPPRPPVVAVLDFYMDYAESGTRKLLDITLHILPAEDSPLGPRWRAYCDKLYCEVRAFLMGNL